MSDVRYGIFLRPDPATCWNVTQVTTALREQFGLVSAGAFAPHATLIGNLRISGTEADLVAALEPVLEAVPPFIVHNTGLVRMQEHGKVTYRYDINRDEHGKHVNEPLNSVARAVKHAVLPLNVPAEHAFSTPVHRYEFDGHLGLASHELLIDDHLADEVGEFIADLPVAPAPQSFEARWYTLFEFTSNWQGNWWETLAWRHVRSWRAQG